MVHTRAYIIVYCNRAYIRYLGPTITKTGTSRTHMNTHSQQSCTVPTVCEYVCVRACVHVCVHVCEQRERMAG